MKKIIAFGTVFASSLFVSGVALAAAPVVTDVTSGVSAIQTYLNLGVQLMIAAAVVFVIWQGFQFVTAGGEEEKRAESRSGIVYGVIGIVVMLSVWGLISIVLSSTGISTTKGTNIVVPSVI